MWTKLKLAVDLVTNMGWRYTRFRLLHMLSIKTKFFHHRFPTDPVFKEFISLSDWRRNAPLFLINGPIDLSSEILSDGLSKRVKDLKNNKLQFFSNDVIDLGQNYNWTTHPKTKYDFGNSTHFADISDLSSETGDIKYVWEKARFGFLQDLMRYESITKEDQAKFVFSEIEDFIDKNPINLGPNYKCSQEISLRLINWIYALYYYKNNPALTEDRFSKILNSIYWQLHHVYTNINFSRIAVRNNHAITETMVLWLSGLIFPFIPEASEWSKHGKAWFEEEIDYQIYDDGSYLQFSTNYHRVVIQLLTVALGMGRLHGVSFRESVKRKASKSLEFLMHCQDKFSGYLPNYGSNDGALFFRWTDDDYRNYQSQLDDLNHVILGKRSTDSSSALWYGVNQYQPDTRVQETASTYPNGGYVVIDDADDTKTFLCNTSYKDRPAQSDNFHLEIWDKGDNILWDPGSYLYNIGNEEQKFFLQTAYHNSLTLDGMSHMKKASRFIWNYWIKNASLELISDKEGYSINASCIAYRWMNNGYQLNRKVHKSKSKKIWNVEDTINQKTSFNLQQHWQINPEFKNRIVFKVCDELGVEISPVIDKAWFSGYYGVKKPSIRYTFVTRTQKIITQIKIID